MHGMFSPAYVICRFELNWLFEEAKQIFLSFKPSEVFKQGEVRASLNPIQARL